MQNNRKSIRTPIRLKLRVVHPELGEHILQSRDVSDTGVFLIDENHILSKPGLILEGQVLDAPGSEKAPTVKMEVVRIEDSGIGLRFI